MAPTGGQHCAMHGAWKSFPLYYFTIQEHAPGQRDENGSYAPTPRSASCRRTRRQGSARHTQTEPCQSAEAGTAAQILPSQADALGYFAPRQDIQLRWSILENIPVSGEPWQRTGLSAQQTSLDNPEILLAASLRVAVRIVRRHPRPGCLHRHPLRPRRPDRRQGPDLGHGPSAGAPIAYGPHRAP